MKSLLLLIVTLLIYSCSSSTIYTKHGILVHNQTNIPITTSDIEILIDKSLSHFSKDSNGQIKLSDITVILRPSMFYADILKNNRLTIIFADGYALLNNKTAYVSVFTRCLAKSALIHELYHLITGKTHNAFEEFHALDNLSKQMVSSFCTKEQLSMEKTKRKIPKQLMIGKDGAPLNPNGNNTYEKIKR